MINNDYKWMVCVKCLTYNHSKYIEDTMNSFCMQRTTFPFVCAIVDDASTDGEPEVIRQYLENHFDLEDQTVVRNEETDDYILCFARNKTNKNCFFAVLWLKYNHYHKKRKSPYYAEWYNNAKYIAICEGDDYWIEPLKLQKQVQILEENERIGMVYSKSITYNQKKDKTGKIIGADYIDYVKLLYQNVIPTATVLYRPDLFNSYKSSIISNPRWKMGDYPFWLYIAHDSSICYLDSVTAIYRKLPNSASHSEDCNREISFLDSVFEIQKYFLALYGEGDALEIERRHWRNCYVTAFKHGKIKEGDHYFSQLRAAGGVTVRDRIRLISYHVKLFFKSSEKV